MTVAELKQELEKYPDTMEVFMAERSTEFMYGLVNSVSKRMVRFHEEYEDEENPLEAFDECVILDEQ